MLPHRQCAGSVPATAASIRIPWDPVGAFALIQSGFLGALPSIGITLMGMRAVLNFPRRSAFVRFIQCWCIHLRGYSVYEQSVLFTSEKSDFSLEGHRKICVRIPRHLRLAKHSPTYTIPQAYLHDGTSVSHVSASSSALSRQPLCQVLDKSTGLRCDQTIVITGANTADRYPQHLRIKAFFGTFENAVKTQIWTAISVYVLVAIIKKRARN